jgi:3-oxoadipate enol-lactonase
MTIAREKGMDALVEPTVYRWFPEETVRSNPDFLRHVRRMIAQTPVNGFYGCAAALGDHDFRAHAAAVRSPVLFLAGEKDGQVPALMAQLQVRVPNSRFVELPGAGHISNMDQPDRFNAALAEFLAE